MEFRRVFESRICYAALAVGAAVLAAACSGNSDSPMATSADRVIVVDERWEPGRHISELRSTETGEPVGQTETFCGGEPHASLPETTLMRGYRSPEGTMETIETFPDHPACDDGVLEPDEIDATHPATEAYCQQPDARQDLCALM